MDFHERLKIAQLLLGREWETLDCHCRALLLMGLADPKIDSVLMKNKEVIFEIDKLITETLSEYNKSKNACIIMTRDEAMGNTRWS